jgi:hypothetical protein
MYDLHFLTKRYSLFNNAWYNLSSKSKFLWCYPVKPSLIIQGIINVYKQYFTRRVWRHQREVIRICNEGQTTWLSKGKEQKDKQRSQNITHKTKDLVTGTPLKTGGEHRYSRRVSSSCSTLYHILFHNYF